MSSEKLEDSKTLRYILIDALLELRLILSMKKITSPTILMSEFKRILDETVQRYYMVKDEITELFKDLPYEKTKKENNVVDIAQYQTDKGTSFEDGVAKKGTSLVKRDGHFNSSANNNQAA